MFDKLIHLVLKKGLRLLLTHLNFMHFAYKKLIAANLEAMKSFVGYTEL